MINITVGLVFLVPWLSIFALWWLWVFERVGLAQTVGGTILFLVFSIMSLVMNKQFLDSLNLRK